MEDAQAQYNHKKELETIGRKLQAEIKILYWRALNENNEEEAKYYSNASKKIELLHERRHLQLLGEKEGYRQVYQTMLSIIENTYVPNSSSAISEKIETIKTTIDEIGKLCEEYGIQVKEEKREEEEER